MPTLSRARRGRPRRYPAGGFVSSKFSPTGVAGLVQWHDASDTSTITDAGAGQCSVWADKSVSARNLTQSTAASRPITGTRTINSRNALDFDGTDDTMATASFSQAQPCTILVVALSDLTAHSGATSDVVVSAGDDILAGPYIRTTDEWGTYANAAEADWNTAVDTAAHVFTCKMNGASSDQYYDGVSKSTTNPGTAGFVTGMRVGGYSAANRFNGLIGEVLVYNSALSDPVRQAAEAYLRTKWATP